MSVFIPWPTAQSNWANAILFHRSHEGCLAIAARRLGEVLGRSPGVSVTLPQTNIVVALLETRTAPDVVSALGEQGVLAIAMDARTLRLVTHRDVSEKDCARAAEVIGAVLG